MNDQSLLVGNNAISRTDMVTMVKFLVKLQTFSNSFWLYVAKSKGSLTRLE